MSWERGRAEIERLLDRGKLDRVVASSAVAERLMSDAAAHLRTAGNNIADDPVGALQLSYDAARKACVALLAVQGLRATGGDGAHVAVIDAARAQFDHGTDGTFGRLGPVRRRRNRSAEYPEAGSPTVTIEDAQHALSVAKDIVGAAERLLASGGLGVFD